MGSLIEPDLIPFVIHGLSFANCDSYAYNITKHDKHVN